MKEEISKIACAQRSFFESNATLSIKTRIDALKKLKHTLIKNENKLSEALNADLGKSASESYMCEIGLVISEINYMLKHIKSFSKEKRVTTPISQFCASSFIKPAPYGVILIMSPWNYPLLLSLVPLVDAVSAGNTVILKPSAYSPKTSLLIKEMLENIFPRDYIAVICGSREENNCLLDEKFDYIFFTGSKGVGKTVLEKAAVHFTPTTLELGGKSPCIIEKSANIKLAAKRVVFGKYLNCGQTCVAPDYILCHTSVKIEFIKHVKLEISRQYGSDYLMNPNYGKIINEKHFNRLCSLLDSDKIIYGGNANRSTLQLEPTVMNNVTLDDAVMKEEIFGPIMPILEFNELSEALDLIRAGDKPLALYIFTENKKIASNVISQCRFGGGCINDTVIHLATSEMGFGGVGESGMGAYHGKVGFDTFSHKKSIVNKSTRFDLPLRYSPYSSLSDKLVRKFLK